VGSFAVIRTRAARLEADEDAQVIMAATLAVMTAAGVVIIAAQPSGTGSLVLSLVAYVAGARLTRTPGLVTVSGATVATVVALALKDSRATIAITSSVLLAALLFVMARLFRSAQADRERAEVATAELEDARERELEAASVAERARIARELHDVLAHSLSGLSLQLEGVRLVAEREHVSEELQEMLARSRRLAADGLEDARRAVRTLRGDSLPGVDDLGRLVEDFSRGGLEIELSVRGDRRAVSAETGLALYRAAQEALTNTVRHSGATDAALDLEFAEATVRLTITDRGTSASSRPQILAGVGSGYGLSAMRERAEMLGGVVTAGPTESGFRVELELPS
jgi:signal transduction histidine kinase